MAKLNGKNKYCYCNFSHYMKGDRIIIVFCKIYKCNGHAPILIIKIYYINKILDTKIKPELLKK
jgi:hypothetical protein